MNPHIKKLSILAMCTLGPLAMAQSSFHISFVENELGQTVVTFSGEGTIGYPQGDHASDFDFGQLATITTGSPNQYSYIAAVASETDLQYTYSIGNPSSRNWVNGWPLANEINLQAIEGTAEGVGGFYYNEAGNSISLMVFSDPNVPVDPNEPRYAVWMGSFAVSERLSALGIAPGESGVIQINDVSGNQMMAITWGAAVVPEPATYAMILGAGVAGCAILRRRTKKV